MTKYPLPLRIVKGRKPIVTQEFADRSNLEWYKQNGINLDDIGHNGTDIVISGGSIATYGTEIVSPVPNALPTKVWFDHAMSSKGNGIQIQWRDERGFCQMLAWHCSECVFKEEYKAGDVIGYIGNSGLVRPQPHEKPYEAYNGAHLHLMVWVKGVLVNPREVFDFDKWFVSEKDTSVEKDLPPLKWVLDWIVKNMWPFKKV